MHVIRRGLVPLGRLAFRTVNHALASGGLLLSIPESLHGSPRFSGATLWARKLYQLRPFFRQVHGVQGDVVESGVHWGYGVLAFLNLIEEAPPCRRIYGFDSFQGHSAPTPEDTAGDGHTELFDSFRVSEGDVWKTLMLGTGLARTDLETRVELIPGWLQSTMPAFRSRSRVDGIRLALVHVDCDLYVPSKATLEGVWDALSPGGIVVLGALHNPELMGKTRALEEFTARLARRAYELRTEALAGSGGLRASHLRKLSD